MSERLGEDRAPAPVDPQSDGAAAGGPSGPAYATLAEGHRRAGRAHEAETLARAGLRMFPGGISGRLALALALLDQRRIEEARREVEGLLESLAEFQAARGALAALIGESAPEPAEPELDVDAAIDGWEEEPTAESEEGALLAEGTSPFATETMAGLLERQGHLDEARALRERLEGTADTEPRRPPSYAVEDDALELPEAAPVVARPEPELAFEAAPLDDGAPFLGPPLDSGAPFSDPPPVAPLRDGAVLLASPPVDLLDGAIPFLAPPPVDAMALRRAQVISTLERWLENLRRGVA